MSFGIVMLSIVAGWCLVSVVASTLVGGIARERDLDPAWERALTRDASDESEAAA